VVVFVVLIVVNALVKNQINNNLIVIQY
jgi:uncharacterized membrane protein